MVDIILKMKRIPCRINFSNVDVVLLVCPWNEPDAGIIMILVHCVTDGVSPLAIWWKHVKHFNGNYQVNVDVLVYQMWSRWRRELLLDWAISDWRKRFYWVILWYHSPQMLVRRVLIDDRHQNDLMMNLIGSILEKEHCTWFAKDWSGHQFFFA